MEDVLVIWRGTKRYEIAIHENRIEIGPFLGMDQGMLSVCSEAYEACLKLVVMNLQKDQSARLDVFLCADRQGMCIELDFEPELWFR